MSDQAEHAIIHLNVPRETKARWVRASRAEGLRLTDWIAGIVEAELRQADAGTEHTGGVGHDAEK